jgi:iron-sulfur cluster repair protein YtfE (RIC family)
MKRHTSLISLSKDHHQGLIIAQILKKNAPVYKGMPSDPEGKRKYILNFWKTELADHFIVEEEILIPEIIGKNSDLNEICKQVLEEHKQIRELLSQLKHSDNPVNELDQIGHSLENHIRLEERKLFGKIQECFDESFLDNLGWKLNSYRNKKENSC